MVSAQLPFSIIRNIFKRADYEYCTCRCMIHVLSVPLRLPSVLNRIRIKSSCKHCVTCFNTSTGIRWTGAEKYVQIRHGKNSSYSIGGYSSRVYKEGKRNRVSTNTHANTVTTERNGTSSYKRNLPEELHTFQHLARPKSYRNLLAQQMGHANRQESLA